MTNFIASVPFVCLGVGLVLAEAPQPSKDPTAVNAVKQLEQDMGDAMVRVDIDKLKQIYADDFATSDPPARSSLRRTFSKILNPSMTNSNHLKMGL